jgi:hypothetical protein
VREYKERIYQFKTNNNMRTKFANLLKPALLIGAVMCCFSCNNAEKNNVKEIEQVMKIELSNYPDKGKYWIVTENYNFFTNKQYYIGDTLRVLK